ncbi:hypothetical protein HYC85_025602 [Camellia sinensis]|uniref:Uncharacterized protein n=1 Tax=Camellia sinensis TaxID=4442 RepID=A0A7J7GFG6_CAMSI|nr:hypothetical protein HYC85_025602 [Camellia sinensis]
MARAPKRCRFGAKFQKRKEKKSSRTGDGLGVPCQSIQEHREREREGGENHQELQVLPRNESKFKI